ncbi:DENN domain-containing protein 3-like [Stigmatopora argus]
MSDYLPSPLLAACVVVGASSERLQEVCQAVNGNLEDILLEPEALYVQAPPFVSAPQAESGAVRSHRKRHRSLLRKKKRSAATATASQAHHHCASKDAKDERNGREDITVPKDIDLTALPQLCFPGGLQVTNVKLEEEFHFLVFTDVFGNKSYGVVMQCSRPIQELTSQCQNGHGSKLFCAYSFCVISKYPYFTALKDCLSCLLTELRDCQFLDIEEKVRAFAAKLSLVPIPPPGQLHLMFTLHPLTIELPSREDKDYPAVDLDLHLPFLCFLPHYLLQVLSCLLQEQRVVLFSATWARLTLVAESLLLFLQPLTWQHPYVPVLARGMLDFLMAPTAFLMGCHLSHFQEVAAETDDLILVNIDNGNVSTSCSETVDLPDIPTHAANCFTERCQSLRIHFDLDQCKRASCTDIERQRAQRRVWRRNLNFDIQRLTTELIVNIFRDVSCHLNYEHRVFNSEEFLKSREPAEQPFYKSVLETHIFHSFLRDRLNRKMDNFARMEISTRSEMQKMKASLESPRRPTMQEIQARRRSSLPEYKLITRQGMSLPNPGDQDQSINFQRSSLLTKSIMCEPVASRSLKPVKILKLPGFPDFLTFHAVQTFYTELIQLLDKAIDSVKNDDSTLLARYYYLRGFTNLLSSRRLSALGDFHTLYKTDTAIFPTKLVTWLVDSLIHEEQQQANKWPELKRLIHKVKMKNEKLSSKFDDDVKTFELPRKNLDRDNFVRCIQEGGIVKDVATIHRLFDALTGGEPKQVDAKLFKAFYTFWKQTEAEAQDVSLPTEVIERLDHSECVYKLSSCIKTSHGVGKIAMTQKRLFLLPEGQPGFLEIAMFRDIQEVKIASAPFLLVRIPSLRIRTSGRSELFEANLKTETDLWNLVVKEMWAGRKMADQHKDPQYMAQALTNVLLMDAVVGCQHNQRSISAASKLAYFDKVKNEVPMMVPKTTSETLKHKIYPSLDLSEPQTVHVLLYTPGKLTCDDSKDEMNPKLWVALNGGRVVVFDAASWSMLEDCIYLGVSQLNCMAGLVQDQVWIGSQDSVIYIIDTHSLSCNKQLTEHRHEVTGLTLDAGDQHGSSDMYSCSSDGTILQWDSSSLKAKRQFHVKCKSLSSIQVHGDTLWCCCDDSIVELKNSEMSQRRLLLPEHLRSPTSRFTSFIVIPERGELWTGLADSGDLYVWFADGHKAAFKKISLTSCLGVTCMIRVKDQIWVGCHGKSGVGGHCDGQLKGQLVVVHTQTLTVAKELQAHSDSIHTLCSAEERYVLSGSAQRDGKIAIWKVE